MKKLIGFVLIFTFVFFLVSCEIAYHYSFEIVSSNENLSVIVNDEVYNSFNFSSRQMNSQPQEKYSNIDFENIYTSYANVKICKFELISLLDSSYKMELKLIDDNKYVLDMLRVAIIYDDNLLVYKYYEENEIIYHKEDDPDTLLHFNSESEIFKDLEIDLLANEFKEIIVVYWIEEAELYNHKGERYTGWKDKSYDATSIMLNMEVK